MRKTILILLVATTFLMLPLFASHQRHYWFLGTAVNVAANTTINYGAALPSGTLDVSKYSSGSLTITFARAAGTTDTVDVEIWCSPEGTTWSLLRQTEGEALLQVQTGTGVITGTTVSVTYLMNFPGIRYLRLGSVFNSDTVNAITGFNVLLSLGDI